MNHLILCRQSGQTLSFSDNGEPRLDVRISELPRRHDRDTDRAWRARGTSDDEPAGGEETAEEIVVVGHKRPKIRFIFFPSAYIWITFPEPRPIPTPDPDPGGGGRPPGNEELCDIQQRAWEGTRHRLAELEQWRQEIFDEIAKAPSENEIIPNTTAMALMWLAGEISKEEKALADIEAMMDKLGC